MHRIAWLLAVVVTAFMSGPLLAGPADPCPSGEGAQTLDWYLGLQGGCAIGNLSVKGFWYSSSGDVIIDPSQITLQPYAGPQGPSLLFSSGAFYAGAGQTAVVQLVYNIDPPPIIIRGFDEEMFAETPVPPGYVTIDTELCVGGAYFVEATPYCWGGGQVTPPVVSLQLAHYGPGDPDNIRHDSALFGFAAPIYMLGVWHTITLDGGGVGGGGSASFSALGNQAYSVPEPGAALLLASGLLGLAFLRRRRSA